MAISPDTVILIHYCLIPVMIVVSTHVNPAGFKISGCADSFCVYTHTCTFFTGYMSAYIQPRLN